MVLLNIKIFGFELKNPVLFNRVCCFLDEYPIRASRGTFVNLAIGRICFSFVNIAFPSEFFVEIEIQAYLP